MIQRLSLQLLHPNDRELDGGLPKSITALTQPYGSNIIWVPSNWVFSLSFEALNPGWIHQNISGNDDVKNSKISLSDAQLEKNINSDTAAYLGGKQLWLLLQVKTLNGSDPLELQSKLIFKASAIKYDVSSFGIVPLDTSELNDMTLTANSMYDIDFKVYEVADVALKKTIADLTSNSPPGLTDLVTGLGKAIKSNILNLAGQAVAKTFQDEYGTDLEMERLLLTSGARVEFEAHFAVLRTPSPTTAPSGNQSFNQYYLFIDPIKGTSTDTAIDGQDSYTTAFGGENSVGEGAGVNWPLESSQSHRSYLLLNFLASAPSPAAAASGTPTPTPSPTPTSGGGGSGGTSIAHILSGFEPSPTPTPTPPTNWVQRELNSRKLE